MERAVSSNSRKGLFVFTMPSSIGAHTPSKHNPIRTISILTSQSYGNTPYYRDMNSTNIPTAKKSGGSGVFVNTESSSSVGSRMMSGKSIEEIEGVISVMSQPQDAEGHKQYGLALDEYWRRVGVDHTKNDTWLADGTWKDTCFPDGWRRQLEQHQRDRMQRLDPPRRVPYVCSDFGSQLETVVQEENVRWWLSAQQGERPFSNGPYYPLAHNRCEPNDTSAGSVDDDGEDPCKLYMTDDDDDDDDDDAAVEKFMNNGDDDDDDDEDQLSQWGM